MKTAICSIIKDEHRFLEEWIEWHLGLGFDAIHLFEDKDSKSHQGITDKYEKVHLRRYEDDEEVRNILESQGTSHRQYILYTWFSDAYREIYNWVAFIDLDEFVFFAPDYNLETLCEEFKSYPAVLLNWKMMGASGRIAKPDCGVIDAYTIECNFCGNDKEWAQKSFVNLKKYEGMRDLHRATNAVNTNHSLDIHELCYDKVWLNHYYTKSLEDWTIRIFERGGTLNGHRRATQFFECNTDMKYLEEQYIRKCCGNIPKGTYYLSYEDKIIAGGNTQKINLLNLNNNIFYNRNLSLEDRLELAISEGINLGFKNKDRSKLIHIFWLGNNEFPDIVKKCINSWKKYLGDYTLCYWNEKSIDLSHQFPLTAYGQKCWAFVVDYLRLWAIYNYGGIYLDTDVELIKSIEDLPNNYLCIERGFNSIAFGLSFAAEKNNETIFDLMSMYDYILFNKRDTESLISPFLTTDYFKSRGWKFVEGNSNFLNFTIFPSEYFSPKDFFTNEIDITENTYAIHHYTKLWE